MQSKTRNNGAQFDAIVAISPGFEGGDKKDQDRARYFPGSGVAAVCDGISSSLYSGSAAKMGVSAAPGILDGDYRERLAGFSQVLLAHRWAAQQEPICIPADVTPAMIPAVREAFRHQLENAYQTTFVAARLESVPGGTRARIICCGDSALYAFRPDGTSLISTRRWEAGPKARVDKTWAPPVPSESLGTEVLVKIIGLLQCWPDLAKRCRILPQHQKSWYVCIPLDAGLNIGEGAPANETSRLEQRAPAEPWLVPGFLIGRAPAIGVARYRVIPNSRSIRHVSTPAHLRADKVDSSVTPVLPDHFSSGRWNYAEEMVPSDTQFVLASDGFYRAFADEAEMWTWLVLNEAALAASAEPLDEIHTRLTNGPGDDDISLVWVRPAGFHTYSGGGIVVSRASGDNAHGR